MSEQPPAVTCRIDYSRAYPAAEFAAYPAWPTAAGGEADSVLFLHADHVVRAGPDGGDTVVFSDDSAAWKIFCRERLHFDQARESLLDTTGQ